MIHKDATRPSGAEGAPAADPLDAYGAAIDVVAELTMALSSAISDVAFADAARLRGELGHALRHAAGLIEHLSGSVERAAAVQQLVQMRGVAIRMFEVAPSPSAAAIAAAESGDQTVWIREETAWIADRLASGTNPRISLPRRRHRDTLPDSPRALGIASRSESDTNSAPTRIEFAVPPSSNENGKE